MPCICGKSIRGQKTFQCRGCKNYLHLPCTELNDEALIAIPKLDIYWACSDCQNKLDSINESVDKFLEFMKIQISANIDEKGLYSDATKKDNKMSPKYPQPEETLIITPKAGTAKLDNTALQKSLKDVKVNHSRKTKEGKLVLKLPCGSSDAAINRLNGENYSVTKPKKKTPGA